MARMKGSCMLYRVLAIIITFFIVSPVLTASDSAGQSSTDHEVIDAFNKHEIVEGEAVVITEDEKHQIMFVMGLALLAFLVLTAGMGVAMGVYGKNLFTGHIVMAGMSLTLAFAHSVVAVVWFWPY